MKVTMKVGRRESFFFDLDDTPWRRILVDKRRFVNLKKLFPIAFLVYSHDRSEFN